MVLQNFDRHNLEIASKVYRRSLIAPPRKRRSCRDERPYFTVPYTIPLGIVAVMAYSPGWTSDRDYWIARFHVYVGDPKSHDNGNHPDDGCPQGQGMRIKMWRIPADETAADEILDADTRIRVEENRHRDVITDGSEDPFARSHLNVRRLIPGDVVFPELTQVGTDFVGGPVKISMVLVPYPWPGREE